MRKIIAAINMSLDGFCDHTAMTADDETHEHYNELLRNAGALLYGRTTYQLMENFWPGLVENPSGNKPLDDFAVLIDNIPKILYSKTLDEVNWKNSTLKNAIDKQEILELKEEYQQDIFVGSPSLINQFTNLDLIDEYQLCTHPVILGKGLPLFKDLERKVELELLKTKSFECGAVVMYYSRKRA